MTVRIITVAGPPCAGKTAIVRQILRALPTDSKSAYLKIDVVQAFEDLELAEEFNIPTKKIYSGDLCPDHMGIMVLKDAVNWAEENNADYLIYESAGLCLRCTPYTCLFIWNLCHSRNLRNTCSLKNGADDCICRRCRRHKNRSDFTS